MDMKRFFLYAIVIAALALAGCGGNGGGGMTGPVDPPDPPDPMPCPDGQTRNADGMCVEPTPPPPMVDHMAVIGGIVNPSTAGDPTTARGTDAANRPGNAAADAEAFNVTAGALGTKPTTTIGTGTNAADDLNLDTLNMDDEFPAGTSLSGQFMNQEMDTTVGQFAGSVHEKTSAMGTQTDTIYVYSNVEGPKSALYNTYYGTADRPGVAGTVTGGVLTLATGSSTGMANLFSGSRIPAPGGFDSLPDADDANTPNVKENEFMGMFNGIPGTFTCGTSGTAGGSCSLTRNADGKLAISPLAADGTSTTDVSLTFTPTARGAALADLMVQGVSYDADYLSFGYWVRATEREGKTTYGIGTFFDGSQPYDAVALATLEGEATYTGKAAGMYGRKTLDQYGQVVAGSDTSGHFTADAMLMARFGGEDIAASKQNQIEGTISNFMDGNQMVSPGWSLELKTIELDGTGQSLTSFTGTTTGDGNWAGGFFGNPAVTDPVTPDAERHPTGVAGEFTGHFPNGHVIGAFGATR